MKLTTNTNVSVDGVMQGLGAPEEDRTGGFEQAEAMLSVSVADYDVADVRPLFGGGTA